MRLVIHGHDAGLIRDAQAALRLAGFGDVAPAGLSATSERQAVAILAASSFDQALSLAGTMSSAIALIPRSAPLPLTLEPMVSLLGIAPLDAPPELLTMQMDACARLAAIEEEERLRGQTANALKLLGSSPEPERGALRILYIGAPTSLYLALENTVSENLGGITATFSSASGLDHLHDETFDAVIFNGIDRAEAALSFCAALRRNANLFNLPIAVILPPVEEQSAKNFYRRGAISIFHDGDGLHRPLGWLLEAVSRERRRRSAEKSLRAQRDWMGDFKTGLFTPGAFEAHLARSVAHHHVSGSPLGLAVLRVLPAHGASRPETETWQRSLTEIASLAGRLLRVNDFGVSQSDTIIMAFPGSTRAFAAAAAKRIAAVAECTSFATSEGGVPLVFEQNALELAPGERAEALIGRALAAFSDETLSA